MWRLVGHGGRFLPQHALAPIPEALAGIALFGVTAQHGPKLIDDRRVLDVLLEQTVESRAGFVAAQVNLVFVWRFADETDLGHVGPGATVRTTRATHDYLL